MLVETQFPDTIDQNETVITYRQLRDSAEGLEHVVCQYHRSEEEHILGHRPGGTYNRNTTVTGWLEYWRILQRIHAQIRLLMDPAGGFEGDSRQVGFNGVESPKESRWSAQQIADLRDALADAPIHFSTEDGVQRAAYPKSRYALDRVEYIDRVLQWLVPIRVAVEMMAPNAEVFEMQRAAIEFEQELQREYLWIATHPGPGVPWEDDGAWSHTPPEWTRHATPFDLLAVRSAFIDCNIKRCNALAATTYALAGESKSDDSTLPAEAFLGLMSSELGVSSVELARRWSKGSIYAAACVKWQQNKEAEEKAEAERKKAEQARR